MLHIESPLVSVDWLQDNFEADNLIVLDATIPKVSSNSTETDSEYIPKSQFFDIKKRFSTINAEFPNTLPTAIQFQNEAQKLGVNSESAVIVYDKYGMYSSARAWWLFNYFGHKNVAVLNGGLPQWKTKGYKTITQYLASDLKGNFKAEVNPNLFTDFEGITLVSEHKNTLIIDARSAERFQGKVPEPRQSLRSGTIPNSINLPFTELIDGYTMKSPNELKLIFNALTESNKKLVFSCGSGITACNLALAATLADLKDITVYDGSWTEYGTLTT